ncbi:threonine dehydratase [Sphingobium sp. AP50]|uniref:threonine ammonia-lyase n=1 Tax=Sphingobium sp. AP50 TaxID=1884369 RepID=UPI0008C510F4|nr:pyridoxal-phosphate dependent enzyme [Sphingobium sp. AP50]SEJ72395.1 threonine dehydratase [Sphingobium sp. AP50]
MLQNDIKTLIGSDGEGFRIARQAISGLAVTTPLLPADFIEGREVRLKAECLQPRGSFKIRAAANVLARFSSQELEQGIACPSAGNFGQGLAYVAARRGVKLTVHAPDNAARVKLEEIRQLGARVVVHPFDSWWQIMSTRVTGHDDGIFIHPVCEPEVVVGNGTIARELLDSWADFDAVIVPVGGGGLLCGIALALRAAGHRARIIGCEVETAAPLSAALRKGEPVIVDRRPSFVDGIGSTRVLDDMWPLLRELVDDVIVVTPDEAADGVRMAARHAHLVVEGAGGAALAAARNARAGNRVVAILSGGNIDQEQLARIIGG